MTCANNLAMAAYGARQRLYAAAELDLADKVEAPDRRFATAIVKLGREVAGAAIAARNSLALSVDDVACAVARSYVAACPVLQLHEAQQEARLGAIRAAELWTPAGGASFKTYARKWIRKRVGLLADRARAVSRPERARLAGGEIEVGGLLEHLSAPPVDFLGEETAGQDERLDKLERFLSELTPLERDVITRGYDLDDGEGGEVDDRLYRLIMRRGLEQLRRGFAGRPRQIGLW